MADYVEAVRVLEDKLGADWTHANAVLHRELDAVLSDVDEKGRKKRYAAAQADVVESMTGEWASEKNPVLPWLPAGLTAPQARALAGLLASRRSAPLYLALLVHARAQEGTPNSL